MNTSATWISDSRRFVYGITGLMLALLLLTPGITFAVESADSESPTLRQLKERFAGETMFRAELSHHFTDAFTGETTDTYGTIWFSRDSYRIDTPEQQVVVDRDVSKVFNKRQNRLIISFYDPDEDEFAPSRFFAGDHPSYSSRDEQNPDGTTVIVITSNDPFDQFSEVRIRLNRDGNPVQIDAVDDMDNEIRTNFRFGRFEPLNTSIFTLDYPSDTEIIDLRD